MSETVSSNLYDELKSIVTTKDLPDLGPKRRPETKPSDQLLNELDPLLGPGSISRRTRELLQGAALFWHDHLEAAHILVQEINAPEASLIHGMIHRREPDFTNSKYWFRRAGKHAIFPVIASKAAPLLSSRAPELTDKLLPNGDWDPFAFVETCEMASRSPVSFRKELQQLQSIEFHALLEHLCHSGS